MKKRLSFITFFVFLGCSSAPHYDLNSEMSLKSLNAVLHSAEDFFVSITESDFEKSWNLLSGKSKKKIIDEIYDTSRANGTAIKKEDIRNSFDHNGLIAGNFWNAARSRFDPEMVLEESRWEIGFINKNKAEIVITYRKSPRPSRLKMYKEKGSWRVGLVETFWSRRYLESIFSFLRL